MAVMSGKDGRRPLIVMKFGGSSVGTAHMMLRTAELVLEWDRREVSLVVVMSAVGCKPVKVTDMLLQGLSCAASGDVDGARVLVERVKAVHHDMVRRLFGVGESGGELPPETLSSQIDSILSDYAKLTWAVNITGEATPRALDLVSGMGERLSVRIMTAFLREMTLNAVGIDATRLIVTDSCFQSANPLLACTRDKARKELLPVLQRGGIPVVTGFIGANEAGIPTTLGRGGSDYSASILGHVLGADEVWIWTDVDGVLSADPRSVPGAQPLERVTYREMSELAYYGAKVLHPRTIRPVMEDGIPVRIKNTFNPNSAGTIVVPSPETNLSPGERTPGIARAVTAIDNLCLFTVEGKGMLGVPGTAARVFQVCERAQTNVMLISQATSECSICFCVTADAAERLDELLQGEFASDLQRRVIDRVHRLQAVSCLTVVGAGMCESAGVTGNIMMALGRADIRVLSLAQGGTRDSVCLVVFTKDAPAAVELVHDMCVHR